MMNYGSQLPLSERYHLIQDELLHSNLQPNHVLSKTDLFELLDSRLGGRTFDRGIAAQLYDRMNKDEHGDFTVDDFIRVYIEAQDFLTQNIVQTQQYLQEYETQRLDAVAKLSELKQEEVLNAHGIMENSILTIQVLDLRDVNRAAFREVFVAINCGESAFETEPYPYTDGMEWSDQFNIEIKTGMEVIQTSIVALGANNQTEVLGEVVIPVRELGDQFFRDEYFDLLDARRNLAGGQIHLKLQWIHSRVKYLENVIRKWEESIQVQLEDREDFEQSLHALNEVFPHIPFGAPQGNMPNAYPDVRFSQGQSRMSHTNDMPKDSIFQPQRPSAQPGDRRLMSSQGPQRDSQVPHVAPATTNKVAYVQDTNSAVIDWKTSGEWGHWTFFGTIALLVLTMFTCFMKASYLELILCVGLLKEYDLQKNFRGTLETVKLLLGILGVATLWSFIWLIIYTSGWGGRVIGSEPQGGALIFVLVVEYFSLFLKLILGVCYIKFYQLVKGRSQGISAAGIYGS